jgi:hypothetical protein
MILIIDTPIFSFILEIKRWSIDLGLYFERSDYWLVNFSVCNKYLIVLSSDIRKYNPCDDYDDCCIDCVEGKSK